MADLILGIIGIIILTLFLGLFVEIFRKLKYFDRNMESLLNEYDKNMDRFTDRLTILEFSHYHCKKCGKSFSFQPPFYALQTLKKEKELCDNCFNEYMNELIDDTKVKKNKKGD